MATGTIKNSNSRYALVTASAQQSEYSISLPTGFDMSNSVIISASYYNGQRRFDSNGTNDSAYPTPYYHSNGNLEVNSSSIGTDYTIYVVLMLISDLQ